MSVIIVDKSTRALTAAQVAMQKASLELVSGVEALVTQQTNLINDITDLEAERAEATASVEVAERKAAAELRLRVSEDRDAVMYELLQSKGLITTTVSAQAALQERVDVAEAATAQNEFVAVKEAESRINAHYQSRISSIEAGHKVEIAELNANAKADKVAITNLREQVDQLREDLKAEREARVSMAEAASRAQGVVVNAGK